MSDPDFEFLCELVRRRSGLNLGPEKTYLVRTRLDPVARSAGLADSAALLARLRAGAPEVLIDRAVNALATHESSFFRDGAPFETLAQVVLPDLIARRAATRTLRIWCAACSSGQEPYSVAIVLQEMGAALSGWRIEIVASDFSKPILEKARAGRYNDFEVRRGLSPERLRRWFQTPAAGVWEVSPALMQVVSFREHNLLDSAAALGRFDVVFCRNVLIYFDVARKQRVLAEIAARMAPDAALFLGSAETILGLSPELAAVPAHRGLYRLAPLPYATTARSA